MTARLLASATVAGSNPLISFWPISGARNTCWLSGNAVGCGWVEPDSQPASMMVITQTSRPNVTNGTLRRARRMQITPGYSHTNPVLARCAEQAYSSSILSAWYAHQVL